MNYLSFRENLKNHTIFSVNEIRKFSPNFDLRRLTEWQHKGYISKVIKGHYIFSDLKLTETVLFEIANRVYSPSYISLQGALALYDVIPESVYTVTSVSTRKTKRFHTPTADFFYQTIKPSIFFGYDLIAEGDKTYKIATLEKAILDFIYLNPNVKTEDDFLALRFNRVECALKLSRNRFANYLKTFGSPSLSRRAGIFLKVVCDVKS